MIRTGWMNQVHGRDRAAASGFTLVEILIGMAILVIFMWGAYNLFSGGAGAAMKAQWITARTNDLRNTFDMLNKRLKATSYPATLLPDGIFDTAKTSGKNEYFVGLKSIVAVGAPKETVSFKAEQITADTVIAQWEVCEPERIDASGKATPGMITIDRLILKPNPRGGKCVTANLYLKSEASKFTSNPSSRYAEGGLSRTRVTDRDSSFQMVEDVSTIRFETKASDMNLPINIEIETRWPKDPKVFKSSGQSIIPNVGIKGL
jgi:prepilin-type N-terminal cleavage/methylation domain-containing protein